VCQLNSHACHPFTRCHTIQRGGNIICTMLKLSPELASECCGLLLVEPVKDASHPL
jgi:hypothetical protein